MDPIDHAVMNPTKALTSEHTKIIHTDPFRYPQMDKAKNTKNNMMANGPAISQKCKESAVSIFVFLSGWLCINYTIFNYLSKLNLAAPSWKK